VDVRVLEKWLLDSRIAYSPWSRNFTTKIRVDTERMYAVSLTKYDQA